VGLNKTPKRTRRNPARAQWFRYCWTEAYGERCARCGGRNRQLTIDHVVPIHWHGPDELTNTQLLCQPCNTEKGSLFGPNHDHRPPGWEAVLDRVASEKPFAKWATEHASPAVRNHFRSRLGLPQV
jgi:5-methylcytosine-specific restriction endonuclease McrA